MKIKIKLPLPGYKKVGIPQGRSNVKPGDDYIKVGIGIGFCFQKRRGSYKKVGIRR